MSALPSTRGLPHHLSCTPAHTTCTSHPNCPSPPLNLPAPASQTATDTPTTTTTNAFLTFRALGHRYDLFIGVTTIGQAEAACVANGGHLVSILGTQEWTAVQNRLARGTYATLGVSYLDLWMGLSVNLNAGLFWTDGSALDYAPLGAPGVTDGTCYSMMCSPTAGQAATGSTCTWQAATAAQGGCRSATKDGYLCKTGGRGGRGEAGEGPGFAFVSAALPIVRLPVQGRWVVWE